MGKLRTRLDSHRHNFFAENTVFLKTHIQPDVLHPPNPQTRTHKHTDTQLSSESIGLGAAYMKQ